MCQTRIKLFRISIFSLALLTLFLPVAVEAVHAQEQPKISVEVKVVSVLATVRDKKGKIVSNLTKDDFDLQEDGRPQTHHLFLQGNRTFP